MLGLHEPVSRPEALCVGIAGVRWRWGERERGSAGAGSIDEISRLNHQTGRAQERQPERTQIKSRGEGMNGGGNGLP